MSDENTVVEEPKEETVSKAEFEKMAHNYESMLGRYKKSEERISELTGAIESMKSSAEKGEIKTSENLTLRPQVAELQQRVQRSEEREEKIKRSASRQAIVNELIANNAVPDLANMAADSILANEGDRIKAVENSSGSYTVAYEDISGIPKTIGNYIGDFMQTDRGRGLVALKANPSVGSSLHGADAPATTKISARDYALLSDEQMKSGNYELVPD